MASAARALVLLAAVLAADAAQFHKAKTQSLQVEGAGTTSGLAESKIVGGTAGSLQQAAYLVQVEATAVEGQWSYTCPGLLVDAKHVVTTADCVGSTSSNQAFPHCTTRVRVGAAATGTGGTLLQLSGVQVHPKWVTTGANNVQAIDYNVAVLTLSQAAPLGTLVKTATLAAVGQTLPAEAVVSVSSWGSTQTSTSAPAQSLRTADFRVILQPACAALYQKSKKTVTARHFCIRTATNKTPCTGDGGAAVARASDGVVFGILSWGGCADNGNPGVVLDLANQEVRSFINSAVKQ